MNSIDLLEKHLDTYLFDSWAQQFFNHTDMPTLVLLDALEFIVLELGLKEAIPISFRSRVMGTQGTFWSGYGAPRQAEIESSCLLSSIFTLAHELTHYAQYASGKLNVVDDIQVWLGQPVREFQCKHIDKPWEQEANRSATVLCKKYLQQTTYLDRIPLTCDISPYHNDLIEVMLKSIGLQPKLNARRDVWWRETIGSGDLKFDIKIKFLKTREPSADAPVYPWGNFTFKESVEGEQCTNKSSSCEPTSTCEKGKWQPKLLTQRLASFLGKLLRKKTCELGQGP